MTQKNVLNIMGHIYSAATIILELQNRDSSVLYWKGASFYLVTFHSHAGENSDVNDILFCVL
jgi:hypothetical protein